VTADSDQMRAMADELAADDQVLAELVRHGLAGRLRWAAVVAAWDALEAHDELPPWMRGWREPLCTRPSVIAATPTEWWDGASMEEVQAFRLAICTCGGCPPDEHNAPDGSTIAGFSDDHVRALLEVADQRLGDRATRTRWLERYAAQLTAESRRRRGAA
jgi:hypothetical protein